MCEIFNFDKKFLFNFLLKQNKPILESTLLNALSNHHNFNFSRKDMYRFHFSLFNSLYEIKENECKIDYLLNIDTMRIRLIAVPNEGCLHYFDNTGAYCGLTRRHGNFCDAHEHSFKTASIPCFDSLREFYLNKENISYNQERIFKKIFNGFMLYSLNTKKVNEALDFFNIRKDEIGLIKKKYHLLAKKYHPDVSQDDGAMMKEINSHYQILNEIFGI